MDLEEYMETEEGKRAWKERVKMGAVARASLQRYVGDGYADVTAMIVGARDAIIAKVQQREEEGREITETDRDLMSDILVSLAGMAAVKAAEVRLREMRKTASDMIGTLVK